MNIGNKIYELRTSKNLSQGDLADKLDVSRQSISKWETDMAVPDLDKLMKICDLFEISLDELTGREQTNKTIDCNKETKGNTTVSAQKIIGYILFALSLIFGLIIFLFGTNEGDFIILPPIAFAMFICGQKCFLLVYLDGTCAHNSFVTVCSGISCLNNACSAYGGYDYYNVFCC